MRFFLAFSNFFLLIFLLFIFLFFPFPCLADAIIISKFSSINQTDWVELYNNSDENINLNQYKLFDAKGNDKSLDCNLLPKGFFSINWSNILNNDGDVIFLKKESEVIDCVAYGDDSGLFCSGKTEADLRKLNTNEYGQRNIESGGWEIAVGLIKADNSQCLLPSPSPSPTPKPTPTPKPSPTVKPTATPKPSPTAAAASQPASKPSETPTASVILAVGSVEPKESTDEAFFIGEVFGASESSESSPSASLSAENKRNLTVLAPLLISLSGVFLLLSAAYPFLSPQITAFIKKFRKS